MSNPVYCYRLKDQPDRELVVIMPDTQGEDPLAEMLNKFGDRLLSFEPQRIENLEQFKTKPKKK